MANISSIFTDSRMKKIIVTFFKHFLKMLGKSYRTGLTSTLRKILAVKIKISVSAFDKELKHRLILLVVTATT